MDYKKALDCLTYIDTFIDDLPGGCDHGHIWDENGETVVETDIGYLFEGIDSLKRYLERKVNEENET